MDPIDKEKIVKDQIEGMKKRILEPDIFEVVEASGKPASEIWNVSTGKCYTSWNDVAADKPKEPEVTYVALPADTKEQFEAKLRRVKEEDAALANKVHHIDVSDVDTVEVSDLLNKWKKCLGEDAESQVGKRKEAEEIARRERISKILVIYVRIDSQSQPLEDRVESLKAQFSALLTEKTPVVVFPIENGNERVEILPVR